MKQLTTAIALTCALIAPLSFTASAGSAAYSQSSAPIYQDFAATAETPTVISIDANERSTTVTLTVCHDYYCFDDKCDNARVQLLWNGQVLPGCESIKPGDSSIFHLQENGKLTIRNLTTEGYTSPWDNQFYPSVAYGYITITLD